MYSPFKKILLFCSIVVCCLFYAIPSTANDTSYLQNAVINKIHFNNIEYSKDSVSFSIPFVRAGNLILIRATADSTEGNFILDTGCQGLVLNKTYFRHYTTTYDHAEETQGITGASAGTEQTNIRSFSFGSIQEYQVKANLANLGSIENSKGIRVLGLVGIYFLKDCELIIDYESSTLLFHVINKKEAKTYRHEILKDTASYHMIPFEITDNRIVIRSTIAGKKLRFIIDCAAETNILDSRLPDKLFADLSVTGKVSLLGVGNKKVEALRGNLASFTIGNKKITDMPVIITNLEKTCFSYGGCIDGVLGIDKLSVTKIGFNFVTRKMYIWK